MSELDKKVNKSIERLRAFEPSEGYYLAFSGGKDSVVTKALMDMAGVKYDAHYRVTSVDPPELVRFIKEKHADVERVVPTDKDGNPKTMWNLIPKKLTPPTRMVRYCCQELKEDGCDGRMCVTGVRWAESVNRKNNQGEVTIMSKSKELQRIAEETDGLQQTSKGGIVLINDNDEARKMIEQCYTRHRTNVNPIIEWSDREVWEFIKAENIPYCELYDEGWHRLGCIGCPMARRKVREREFARWGKFKHHYLVAFDKMLKARTEKGKISKWQNAQDVFNWWMEYDILPGQYSLFEEEE